MTSTCVVTRTHSTFGDRAFAAAGPGLWDSLPPHFRDADLPYSRFRRSLKTFCLDSGATAPSRNSVTYVRTYLFVMYYPPTKFGDDTSNGFCFRVLTGVGPVRYMSISVQTISVHKIIWTEVVLPFWPTSVHVHFGTVLLRYIPLRYIRFRYMTTSIQ